MYRIRDATRDELLGTLEKNKDRIWVPYQFALEYHRNRLEVIAEQAGKYGTAAEHTKKLIAEFESDRVPFVTSASLEALHKLQGELEEQRDAAFALLHEDPHLGTLSTLLDGRIGDPPDGKLRSEMLEQARVRFHKGVPPGNRDAWKARRDLKTRRDEKQEAGDIKKVARDTKSEEPKAKDSDAKAAEVKTAGAKPAKTKTAEAKAADAASAQDDAAEASNVYGDCIGWLEILREAQARKAPCLLLTDDRKEDWWQFQAGRRIGPLPALVREFQDRCGERFHMYLPSRFLEWSTERGLKVEGATIKELAELEQAGFKAESTEETFEMSRQKAQPSIDDKRERTGG